MARIKALEARIEVAYRRTLSPSEVAALRAGLWPRDMDDRWIVYLADDCLAIHRSWTGHCIYMLPTLATAEGLVIGPLFVSDDPASYRRQGDTKEIEMVEYLIDDSVRRIQQV
jgi:hypothetical protein